MEFKCLPFHEIGHEIARNMKAHYTEMSEKEGYGEINADWKTYLDLSGVGNCLAFVAMVEERMVAYSVFILSLNINHKTIIEASNTAMYVWPDYRGKGTLQFFKWINDYLQNLGVKEIGYLVRDERIGKLLGKIGMKPTHTLWTLRSE